MASFKHLIVIVLVAGTFVYSNSTLLGQDKKNDPIDNLHSRATGRNMHPADDGKISNCNVCGGMENIIKTSPDVKGSKLAKKMRLFLENNHTGKKWIVVVFYSGDGMKYVQSDGFYTASADGVVALAISPVSRTDAPEFYQRKDRLFDSDFKFPFNTKDPSSSSRSPWNAFQIFGYLNRQLTPLRVNSLFDVETLVIQRPVCAPSEKDMMKSFIFIETSVGLEKVHLTNNGSCVSNLVMSVPVRVVVPYSDDVPISSALAPTSDGCSNTIRKGGVFLRNEVFQSYLTIANPSSVKTYAVLNEKRENGDGQKWQFVNDTLMSFDGKCLIVPDNGDLSDVLVENCNAHNGKGRKWRRHGLQIVNGFNKCLSFKNKRVVQADCQHSPAFLWYDWDVDCEDAVMIHVTNLNHPSLPVRNEFSKRYLSLDENGVWVTNEPWGNRPEQYWQFVNGHLLNQNGKCLAKKVKFNLLADNCDGNFSQKWSYNRETHQIVDVSSTNCLGVSIINGELKPSISPCNDHALHQRWRFVGRQMSARKASSRQDYLWQQNTIDDTRNVSREMQQVMSDEKLQDREGIANAVLRFLEEKYDTKKWLVVVCSEESQIHHDLSGGFHIAKVNGFFAAAISADLADDIRDFSKLSNAHQMQSFKFLVETFNKGSTTMAPKTKGSAHSIYQQFCRFLATKTSGHSDFEIFVFVRPDGAKTNGYITIVASSNFEWKIINVQDKYLIGAIITTSIKASDVNKSYPSSAIQKCQDKLANVSSPIDAGLLPKEMAKGYLYIVLGDSTDEATQITALDQEWRNATGPKGALVNNTPKNGNGKVLAASMPLSTYLLISMIVILTGLVRAG